MIPCGSRNRKAPAKAGAGRLQKRLFLQKHCSVFLLRLLFAADARSSVFFIFCSGCGIIINKTIIRTSKVLAWVINIMKRDQLFEILRFAIVGGASFLVDYALLYICTEWLGIHYLYSAAISFTVSVIVNYWLCVVFVFTGAGKQTGRQAALFIGSSIVGLGINQVCMWLFVEKFGLHYMLAKIGATVIVMFWNYVMKRKAVRG